MSDQFSGNSLYFHRFQSPVDHIALPEKFNYPFAYEPHEIARLAARELQTYLQTQNDWQHDFGMEAGSDGEIIGKMFGVLVVRNQAGELGYLCAFSGRLAGHNQHEKFVPPVFDILKEDGFFRKGESIISEINQRLFEMENHPDFWAAKRTLAESSLRAEAELNAFRQNNQKQKALRHQKRLALEKELDGLSLQDELMRINQQSINEHYQFKQLKVQWKETLAKLEATVAAFQQEMDVLKEERKNRSSALQDAIFDQYYFVNRALERRSVGDIFKYTDEGRPKAGAGECAAPKLLQYAFLHHLEPIALAEFWWGQSPKTEVRLHGHFYPACRGKCEPILGHMLKGMDVEDNPLLHNPAEGKELSVVWEDEYIVVVNKPAEFLSVPGKKIDDSVLSRLRERYPQAAGPLVVHRLDMSTSGLLMAAKSLEVYQHLQRQFAAREVKKRYVAVLEGNVHENGGWIDLPLRVDLDDRPRQMVCYTYGKPAQTRWEVVERMGDRTRVYFYPVTGRTHQLRVHAAHALGLHHPIVGDDLYGQRSTRLHLHAEFIEFKHPVTEEIIRVEALADFGE